MDTERTADVGKVCYVYINAKLAVALHVYVGQHQTFIGILRLNFSFIAD